MEISCTEENETHGGPSGRGVPNHATAAVPQTATIARDDATGVWTVTPPRTADRSTMRSVRAQLVDLLETEARAGRGRVRLVFDLRECALGLEALAFALRTLARYEAFMRARLERSAALVPRGNRAIKALCDAFLRAYTPVRPFAIEVAPERARAFAAAVE